MASETEADGIDHRAELDDHALDAHDRQKDWSEEIWGAVIEGLIARVESPCVEVGVGTGLVALRLRAAGVDVIGADLNSSMLAKLRRRDATFPAVMGDAMRLPFGAAKAASVVVSNVLHLVEEWPEVLRELAGTLRPGGCLAVNLGSGGCPPPEVEEVRRSFFAHFPNVGRGHGPANEDELGAALERLGLRTDDVVEVEGLVRRSVREFIDRLEHNPFAWPTGTSKAALREAADAVRGQALARFASIDEPLEHLARVRLSFWAKP